MTLSLEAFLGACTAKSPRTLLGMAQAGVPGPTAGIQDTNPTSNPLWDMRLEGLEVPLKSFPDNLHHMGLAIRSLPQ